VIGVSESEHINTKATTHTIVSFGSYSMYLITFVIILIILLIGAASTPFFFIAKTVAKVKRQRSKLVPSKRDYLHTFSTLRKNLENHLEILQEIRHKRLLTKAERNMKDNIEKSLDDIDKVILKEEEEK